MAASPPVAGSASPACLAEFVHPVSLYRSPLSQETLLHPKDAARARARSCLATLSPHGVPFLPMSKPGPEPWVEVFLSHNPPGWRWRRLSGPWPGIIQSISPQLFAQETAAVEDVFGKFPSLDSVVLAYSGDRVMNPARKDHSRG